MTRQKNFKTFKKKKPATFDTRALVCRKGVKKRKKKDIPPPPYTGSLVPVYHDNQIKSDKLERLNSNPNKKQVHPFIYFIDH